MPAAPIRRDPAALARRLLAWYDRHARVLPWRLPPRSRRHCDPYRVWLSEVMLQQTTVAAVGRYFQAFTERWPDVAALAAATPESVLQAWAGLGYYARARNLHRCAQAVVEHHGGHFPADIDRLRALPGIGVYTAAAVAAIAFDRPVVPVDGNVERVLARLDALDRPLAQSKAALRARAQDFVTGVRVGDFAQALMDLGATVCTPRAPRCGACPWRAACRAFACGSVDRFPVQATRKPRPRRHAVAFVVIERGGGAARLWVRRRPPSGLLGGMLEVPSTPWTEQAPDAAAARRAAPVRLAWTPIPGAVRHVFTHFELHARVWSARIAGPALERLPGGGKWVSFDTIADAGFPTLMRKIVDHAVDSGALERG